MWEKPSILPSECMGRLSFCTSESVMPLLTHVHPDTGPKIKLYTVKLASSLLHGYSIYGLLGRVSPWPSYRCIWPWARAAYTVAKGQPAFYKYVLSLIFDTF